MTADRNIPPTRQEISGWLVLAAQVCFAAAIVLLPLRYKLVLVSRPAPPVYPDYTDYLLYPADAAVLLTLALWLASLVVRPRRLSWGPRVIWIPLASLTLIVWVAALTSLDAGLSVYHAIRLAGLFWFYVFVVNEISNMLWVLVPVGIQLVTQAAVAIPQFILQHSLGLQVLGEIYVDPAQAGASVVTADGMRLLRVYGLTDHPNILGGCLAFGLLLLIPYYLHGRAPWLMGVALLAAGVALLVTFSRSAWLAAALGSLLIFVLDLVGRKPAIRRWLLLGVGWLILAVPILLTYPRFFGVRLNAGNSFSTPSAEQQSIGERVLLLRSAASVISSHPLLGVGLGTAPLALKRYQPDWRLNFEPPHVALVDAALEIGLPGAALYLAVLLAPFIAYLHRRGWLDHDPGLISALALLTGLTVVGFFDYYTWMGTAGRLWQWSAWGLWALMSTRGRPFLSNASNAAAMRMRSTEPARIA